MAGTSEDDAARVARRTRERQRMAAIPATYADSYTVTWWSEGIRISFAEFIAGERHYRMAVMMSLDDAEDLANTLLRSVQKAREDAKAQASS